MVDRVVRVQLVGDASSLVQAANQASSALRNIGGSASNAGSQASSGANQAKSAWERFKESVAGQVAIGDLISKGVEGGFGLIKDGIKQVIDQGMSYEQNMNTLQAVTSASAAEMEALGARAKQLGNDVTIPGASAGTAAEALKELAKGGLDVKESMAAAAGTLRLAAAAQVDGGRAAEIQANALNAFRLGADQADHVADLLANAANAASGEVTDMASSLQQSATVAAGFGISIDETTTTLALFAKNGLLGSDAGTSFKTMLTSLASPTEAQASALADLGVKVYDARGQFVGMETVTDQLAKAHQRMTTEQYNAAASTAFGTDAIRAANILGQEASAGFEDMAGKVAKAGGAQELAAAQSQGFTGALDRLSNAGSAVALELYEKVSPALTQVADFGATAFGWVGTAVGWMGELPAPVWAGVTALGAMILLKGPLNALFLQAIAGYTRMALAVRGASFSFAGIATTARAAMAAIGGPFGLAVIGITTALSLFSSSSDDAAQSTEGLNDAIDEQTGKLKGNAAQLIATEAANSGASAAYERIGGKVSDYVDALGGVPGAQEKVNAKLAEAKAAYDAHQAAIQAASQGTAGFTGAQAAAGAAAGQAVPAIDDLNKATGYLSSAQGTLSQRTDDVRLANEGATGALGATAGAASGAGSAAVTAAEAFKAYADNLKVAQDNAQTLADNTVLAQFLGAAKLAADDANRSMSYFKQLQDELTGHTRSYNDAVAAQSGNLANLKKAFEDGTKAARENTDAGNLNVDALNNWQVAALTATSDGRSMYDALTRLADGHLETANAAYQQAITQGKTLPEAMAAGRAEADANRQAFIDLAMQYNGGNREAAENLANKLGILAGQQIEDKNFQVIADDKQAQDALAAAQAATIADKVFRITALANVDQASLDAANAKAAAFGYATTDYEAIKNQKADGGWITGPGGPRDDKVKARLSPGEFVVNAAQAAKHAGLLEAINDGAMGFADGGVVPGGDTTATAGAAVAVTAPDPTVFEAAWAAISEAAKTAWEQVILPVMQAMSVQNLQAGTEFTALATTIQQQQAGVIQPTYDALNTGTQGVGTWQQWLAQVWAQSWQSNQDRTAAGVASVGASWSALSAATDAAWSSIGARIQGTYDGQIVPAWNGVQSFAAQVGGLFANMQAGVSGATDQITGDIASIKSTLEDFFTVVDGRTPKLADGGSVADAVAGAFADGGPITVGTGPRSDDVLIRVSRGEYVVNAAATAKHRDTLDAINNGTEAFADGGFVGDKIKDQLVNGMQVSVGDAVSKVLAALSFNVAGFNPSQDPSSFGWQRAQGIVPFSWQGHPILGGVAGGTERLWTSLLDFLVPQIPGGLTEPMYGFENRDNVNSPGRASFHAYGLATDINAGANPNGVPIDARSGQGVIPTGAARQIASRLGFLWGGDFGGTPDSMHFELHLPPALLGGVGAATSFATGAGWKQSVLDAIGKAKENALAPVPTSSGDAARYSPTGGVEQWRALGLQVLTNVGNYLGRDLTGYIDNMLLQISTESSGNPNAINNWDSNAMRGTPSKGLMQVIDPTAATALRGTPFEPLLARGMFDPEANMTASTLYGLVTGPYHDLAKAWRGVAYAGGGLVLGPGGPFDDQIPARLSNGEFVVNAKSAAANLPLLHAVNSGGFEYSRGQMQSSAANIAAGIVAELAQLRGIVAQLPLGDRGIHFHGDVHANERGALLAELEYAAARVR